MASVLPSLAIIAVDSNGVPEEFSRNKSRRRSLTPRRRRSLTPSRRRSVTPTSRRHGRPENPRKPSVIVIEQDESRDEEEGRVAPPPPQQHVFEDEVVVAAPRRGFLSRKLSNISPGRMRGMFRGRSKTGLDMAEREKNDDFLHNVKDYISMDESKKDGQGSVASKNLSNPASQGSTTMQSHMEDLFNFEEEEDNFVAEAIISGKSNLKKIRDNPASTNVSPRPMDKLGGRTRSFSSAHSLTNKSLTTSTSRRSRHSGTQLIQTPVLDDLSEEDVSAAASTDFTQDSTTRQEDDEIRWLAGGHRSDNTTTGISTIGGQASFLGVDSVIGDPTAICGLLHDVIYRDLRNFCTKCSGNTECD